MLTAHVCQRAVPPQTLLGGGDASAGPRQPGRGWPPPAALATVPARPPLQFSEDPQQGRGCVSDPGAWGPSELRSLPLPSLSHVPAGSPRRPVPRGRTWGQIETRAALGEGQPGLDSAPPVPSQAPYPVPGPRVRPVLWAGGRGQGAWRGRWEVGVPLPQELNSLNPSSRAEGPSCGGEGCRDRGGTGILVTFLETWRFRELFPASDTREHSPRACGADGAAGPGGACWRNAGTFVVGDPAPGFCAHAGAGRGRSCNQATATGGKASSRPGRSALLTLALWAGGGCGFISFSINIYSRG